MRTLQAYPALLLVFVATGCMSGDLIDPSDRPDPPPAAAFDADFSYFEGKTPAPDGTASSWAQALQTVALARSEMEVLDVPEALVRAATAGQGTRDGDAWRWPFSTTVNEEPYEGELRSTVAGGQYRWDLIVSAPDHSPQLTNYLWAQGNTLSGGNEGGWALADVASGSDSIAARVSWVRNVENGVNFGFSASDTAGWLFERSQAGNILTYYVYSVPQYGVTWFPASGTGRSWTSATGNACWNEDLHDVAC